MPTILEALEDRALFGSAFPEASWRPWRSFLGAMFGLALPDDLASYARALTGRTDALTAGPYREGWIIAGRRSGKSRVLALIATYLACFVDWRRRLSIGETGTIMCLATDRSQAAVLLDYIKGLLRSNPLLAQLVTGEGAEWIELAGRRVALEVHASLYKAVRGRTLIACLADECAFWKSETSVNPAGEVIRAVRPALVTLAPDSLLIGASSPYSRQGALWDVYRRHYGREGGRTLIWKASSRDMNPSLSADVVADALEEDPEAGAAEWLAEFRSDIARFVDMDVVQAAVIPGRRELPRLLGVRYHAFCDPSGGSSDGFSLGIAHREGDRAVLDVLTEFRPRWNGLGYRVSGRCAWRSTGTRIWRERTTKGGRSRRHQRGRCCRRPARGSSGRAKIRCGRVRRCSTSSATWSPAAVAGLRCRGSEMGSTRERLAVSAALLRSVAIGAELDGILGDIGLQKLSREVWLRMAGELAGGADLAELGQRIEVLPYLHQLVHQVAQHWLRSQQDRPVPDAAFGDGHNHGPAYAERAVAQLSVEACSAVVASIVAEAAPEARWGRLDNFDQVPALLEPLRAELEALDNQLVRSAACHRYRLGRPWGLAEGRQRVRGLGQRHGRSPCLRARPGRP